MPDEWKDDNWSFEWSHNGGKDWQRSGQRLNVAKAREEMSEWAMLCFINDVPHCVRLVRVV